MDKNREAARSASRFPVVRHKERRMLVEPFRIWQLSPRVVRIGGLMHEFVYLIKGDERAALIDSGCGFGSLRQVAADLTGLPLTVLLTHGHMDHAMGAGEFDEVWMDRRDIPVFHAHAPEEYRRAILRGAQPRLEELPPMVPAADPARFLPLSDGACFDLGGVHLDVFGCPGHTPGTVVVLLRELRTLVVGDACSNFTFLAGEECLPIPVYRQNLLRLKERLAGRFDVVLEAHGSGSLPAGILDGVIEVCGDVLAGNTDDVPCTFADVEGVLAKVRRPHSQLRADGKYGNIFYKKQL